MSNDNFNELLDQYQAKKRAIDENIMTLSTPIEKLPKWRDVKGKMESDICVICRRAIKEDEIVENCVVCEIYFHFKELRQWVKTSQTCPSCKNKEQ